MPRAKLGRAVGMAALVGWVLSGGSPAYEEPGGSGDAILPRLVLLPPGMAVDGGLTGGWTDRVIRSVPQLASGAIGTLPDSAKRSATLFRTAILARVAGERGAHRLRSIGLGNAVPFEGRDVVVTPEGPSDVLATLSTVEKVVARRAYDELARARIVARTPTFALLSTPARLVVDGKHAEVDLFYAFLADPATGALTTLNWATRPGDATAPRRISRLPRDLTFDCGLDVAVDRKIGPLNVSWSFAMASLPAGRPVEVTPAVAAAIESSLAGRSADGELETAFRKLVAAPTAAR